MESGISEQGGVLAPFLSIWFRPRQTLRNLLQTDPNRLVIPLAMLAGIARAFTRSASRGISEALSLPMILMIVVVGGAGVGILMLYVGSILFRWTGRWLGGKATSAELRTAFAWSSVPSIPALVLIAISLGVFGKDYFMADSPSAESHPFVILATLALMVVLGIWKLVLTVKCVGEAHRFSDLRSIASLLAGALVVGVPVLAIAGAFIALR